MHVSVYSFSPLIPLSASAISLQYRQRGVYVMPEKHAKVIANVTCNRLLAKNKRQTTAIRITLSRDRLTTAETNKNK